MGKYAHTQASVWLMDHGQMQKLNQLLRNSLKKFRVGRDFKKRIE